MIRILHLTDFHLNNKTLKDWNDFIKEPFLNKIEKINNQQKIDLVLFTGDMIDQAGKDFGTIENGLNSFKENVINPVITKLGLGISRFIICPGNHDINRNLDKSFVHNGLFNELKSIDAINKFTNEHEEDYSGIERIKEYKEFEFQLYKDVKLKVHSKFKFSLKLDINGQTVGISSLNSSWRCYDENDYKNILLGENQLNDNYKFVENCGLKIALMHHQLDWLSEIESKIVKSHISKNYDIIFSGHVHQFDIEQVKNITGESLRVVSPSGLNQIRQNTNDYLNGFSLIDYNENAVCHFYKYNHAQRVFVDNTDVIDKGILELPPIDNLARTNSAKKLIVDEEFIDFLNDSGANFTHRTKSLTLDDIYVAPFMEQFSIGEQEEKGSSIKSEDILQKIIDKEISHTIILGEENSGKTSFCKKVYLNVYPIEKTIPVYIKGRDIKKVSVEDINKLINREYKKQYKNELDFDKKDLLVIIDDFNNCMLPQKSKKTFILNIYSFVKQTVITWD